MESEGDAKIRTEKDSHSAVGPISSSSENYCDVVELRDTPPSSEERRMYSFQPPFGYRIMPTPEKKRSRSIIYDKGVLVQSTCTELGQQKWHCMVGSCTSTISVKSNKSNITDHLRHVHGIESQRTRKLVQDRLQLKSRIMKERKALLQISANRYHELNVVKLIIKQLLPFSIVEDEQFRLFARMLDHKDEFNYKMPSERVRRVLLEIYLACTDKIKFDFNKVIQTCALPMFHLNVDLWTSKISCEKYFGIRVFFVNEKWEMKSALLAVTVFRPAAELSSEKLSDVLKLWTERVLSEFNLTADSVFSSTSDSGSDVKRLCSKLLPGRWDWCVSHLCNCALVEAFGTNLHAEKCKNLAFRSLLKRVKKVIEHLHKSSSMREKFEDMQFKLVGTRLKLVQDMPHRCLGTIRVLERFLLLWDTLRKHYFQTELKPFPVDDSKKRLIELYSLMRPVGEIIKMAQCSSYPASVDVFQALCVLRKKILDPAGALPIFDPSLPDYKKQEGPSAFRDPSELEDVTKKLEYCF